jgi:nucleotide-binding universal stress UspA family protein
MTDAVAEAPALFRRIVCGVDGTPESMTAVKQAARLRDDDGELRLVSAANLALAAHAGMGAMHAADLLQQDAESALAEARRLVPSGTERLVDGDPVAVLLREAEQATLLALGTHGRGRAVGHFLGLSPRECSVTRPPLSHRAAGPRHRVASIDSRRCRWIRGVWYCLQRRPSGRRAIRRNSSCRGLDEGSPRQAGGTENRTGPRRGCPWSSRGARGGICFRRPLDRRQPRPTRH